MSTGCGNRMHVPSPKTEHHAGKQQRDVPIFAELRPFLEAAFEAAADGEEYVVGGPEGETYRKAAYRGGKWRNCNLRSQFALVRDVPA